MPDRWSHIDPTAPLTEQFSNLDELRAYVAHVAARVASTPPTATATAPTPTVPAPTATPADEARQAALEAAKAAAAKAAEDAEVLVGARELLRQKFQAAGFPTDTVDEMPGNEVLEAVGVQERTLTAEEQRIATENRMASDPTWMAAYDRQRAKDEFSRSYWQLSPGQREAAAAEAGVDLQTFQPPRTVGGTY